MGIRYRITLFIFGGVSINPAMALAKVVLGVLPAEQFIPVISSVAGHSAGAVIVWFMYADHFTASEGQVDVQSMYLLNKP